MKKARALAVAAEDELGLDGRVAGHFGRCPAYVVVNTVGDQIQDARVVRNPHFHHHEPGQVPQFVRSLEVDAILAGGMGPRAVDMFSQFGIEVATGIEGTVREAVGEFLSGRLKGTVPCNHDHPDSCGGSHHG